MKGATRRLYTNVSDCPTASTPELPITEPLGMQLLMPNDETSRTEMAINLPHQGMKKLRQSCVMVRWQRGVINAEVNLRGKPADSVAPFVAATARSPGP
jgi:hypothetical protein